MKTSWPKIALIECLVLLLAGCNQVAAHTTPNNATRPPTGTAPVAGTPTVPVTLTAIPLTQEEALQVTPSLPAPVNSGLQGLIERAKEDLAQRLSISVTQISLVEAAEVEWSDSSLDCPQPGMDYLQVITPGYRILLEAGGQEYAYHSNRDAYFVYCENPNPLIPPPKP